MKCSFRVNFKMSKNQLTDFQTFTKSLKVSTFFRDRQNCACCGEVNMNACTLTTNSRPQDWLWQIAADRPSYLQTVFFSRKVADCRALPRLRSSW